MVDPISAMAIAGSAFSGIIGVCRTTSIFSTHVQYMTNKHDMPCFRLEDQYHKVGVDMRVRVLHHLL